MIKLYKNKNPHIKRLSFLFIYQVIFGILPALLFTVYAVRQMWGHDFQTLVEEYDLWVGIIFISIILFSFAGYIVTAQRYNVLVSGFKGERLLIKTAKKLTGNFSIFTNLPVRYKHNRSEIDLLLVGENGILIIEVKNHSGVLIGSHNDETWIQRKYYRKGKIAEIEMRNPFKQIKRQREIIKSILRSNGLNFWIDSILFFSGNPSLRIKTNGDIDIAVSENELIALIADYRLPNNGSISEEDCAKIVEVLRSAKV